MVVDLNYLKNDRKSRLPRNYKRIQEQVRVLKEQLNELTDAGKAKDSALKRTLQKLEYVTEDLDKANEELNAKQDLEKTKK